MITNKFLCSKHNKALYRWFLSIFSVITVIFCAITIPLLIYAKSTYTRNIINETKDQLNSSIIQLENTLTGIVSISETLKADSRFKSFLSATPDLYSTKVSDWTQLQKYLTSYFSSYPLIADYVLQFSQNIAITNTNIFPGGRANFYPDFFSINELSYEEWNTLLENASSKFITTQHIVTNKDTYDALIYVLSLPTSYLYVCLDTKEIYGSLISSANVDDYYITIYNDTEDCLYNSLPQTDVPCHVISQRTSIGKLTFNVYVPKYIISQHMHPFYHFIGIYCTACVLVLLFVIMTAAKFSAKPLFNITKLLESSSSETAPAISANTKDAFSYPSNQGFLFIQNNLRQKIADLNSYISLVHSQNKMLQIRFFEKALNGQMVTPADKESFYSYFPDFPKQYRLISLKLTEHESQAGTVYQHPIQLICDILLIELSNIYIHQINNTDLLLLISESHYDDSIKFINFLINNITKEEPRYYLSAIASKPHFHLEELPVAYRQIQSLEFFTCIEDSPQVHIVENIVSVPDDHFRMTDMLTLYTAITYGNDTIAIQNLHNYAENLNQGDRRIYELICSILNCLKLEQPLLLIDVEIPLFRHDMDLFTALENTIKSFCATFRRHNNSEENSFVSKIRNYIDTHYTNCDFGINSLEAEFNYSSSKIRKNFKEEMGITISDYIEKKRMDLACRLLATGKNSIAEIALNCGYSNSNSFYKAYKRTYGHSPTIHKETY